MSQENLPTMWLAAMQTTDFRTINEFRGNCMKAMMDELFETMILKLIEDKYIIMENYFLDGTKLEADANKYSFVWKKSTFHFEENLKKKIQETLRNIHEIAQAEALELDSMPIDEVAPEQLEVLAAELEKQADSLTEKIENTKEVPLRKALRARRSALKKPKVIVKFIGIPIFEEMKTKAKTALECDKKAAIYARRKFEVESVFGHIKGNRSFRRFFTTGS